VLICPGPGEEKPIAARDFPGCITLPGVGLGAYAALLRDAALVVANDTGPGHMAAAVGTPLVSVLGPTDPAPPARQGLVAGPEARLVAQVEFGRGLAAAQAQAHRQALLQSPLLGLHARAGHRRSTSATGGRPPFRSTAR
jgi:ADP-heptose:LPS heptosyltransferase